MMAFAAAEIASLRDPQLNDTKMGGNKDEFSISRTDSWVVFGIFR